MRLVAFSDLHGDARTSGVRRFDEACAAMKQAFRKAVEVEADYVAFLGDLADPDGPDAFRILGEIRRENAWAALENVGFLAISGNHDVFEDGCEPRSILSALGHDGVIERPTITSLCARGERLPVLFLPFTPSWAPYDPEEVAERFVEEHPTGPGLVLGHLNLKGIHPGSEAKEFARGRDVFWPLDVLEPHAGRLVMLGGHVHKAQRYRGVEIVGSSMRLDHGEESHEPRFLVVEV